MGLYSEAISCVTMVSFVFATIIDSMRPYILGEKNSCESRYEKSVVCLYAIVFYLSLAYCVFCFVFGKYIIFFLYGKEYEYSIPILRLLVWYAIFNYYGGAQSIWFLAENKQKYLTVLGTTGAVLNIILNFILISAYGACGAAIATLVTSLIANVLLCIIIKPLRGTTRLLAKAINPLTTIAFLKGQRI